ncbi:MAG: histidine triad nucleotide-binding protein [Thermogutta sp.]
MTAKTVFQRIIDREIPADIVYEDADCLAFRDINPQAPIHILLIPKKGIADFEAIREDDEAILGKLLMAVRRIAEILGLDKGFRLVLNNGRDAGQEVPHLHFHILAGRPFGWPPG